MSTVPEITPAAFLSTRTHGLLQAACLGERHARRVGQIDALDRGEELE